MNMIPDEQRKAQQDAGKDDLVQYVEELANVEEYPEGDTWISLTDAARITRTSEAMARRWVTSGRLQVKKEPVGIPPRTRLVRLSDVAKIRPIVDPTAAITGEVRKLDLASIPRQQLQIMEDHQHLLQQVQAVLDASKQHEASTHATLEQVMARFRELADGQEKFAEETRQTWHAHQQQYQALAHRDEEQQQLIQQVRDTFAESLRDLDRSIHQELVGQQEQHQHDLEQLRTYLLGQLTDAQQALERKLTEQGQEHRKQVDHVRCDLVQQQEALATLRQDITTLVEQQVREVFTAVEQLARDQAQDVAAQNERLETIEKRMEQVATRAEAAQVTALGAQKRADDQDQRLQEVRKILQGEVAARQALEQRIHNPSTRSKRPT
jgi:uncharacterized protein YbcI